MKSRSLTMGVGLLEDIVHSLAVMASCKVGRLLLAAWAFLQKLILVP